MCLKNECKGPTLYNFFLNVIQGSGPLLNFFLKYTIYIYITTPKPIEHKFLVNLYILMNPWMNPKRKKKSEIVLKFIHKLKTHIRMMHVILEFWNNSKWLIFVGKRLNLLFIWPYSQDGWTDCSGTDTQGEDSYQDDACYFAILQKFKMANVLGKKAEFFMENFIHPTPQPRLIDWLLWNSYLS